MLEEASKVEDRDFAMGLILLFSGGIPKSFRKSSDSVELLRQTDGNPGAC